MKIVVSCPLGWSSLLAKECKQIGYKAFDTFDTGTYIMGELEAIYMLNIWSRIANKVFIVAEEKKVYSFDEIFDVLQEINRKQYIKPQHGISIKVSTKNSVLSSQKTIQSIAHKSIMNSLVETKDGLRNIDTTRQTIKIHIVLQNNFMKVLINTSGASLHERGYRQKTGEAPIKENIAAAILLQSGRKFTTPLIDPFCGSGTIPIEAAMIAKNIAPGLQREFAIEDMPLHQEEIFQKIKMRAKKKQYDKEYQIFGSDKDRDMISIAKNNAKKAGVADSVTFFTQDFTSGSNSLVPNISHDKTPHLVSNPPYGKRLDPKELQNIYKKLTQLGSSQQITGGFVTLYPLKKTSNKWKTKPCYNGPDKCIFWRVT